MSTRAFPQLRNTEDFRHIAFDPFSPPIEFRTAQGEQGREPWTRLTAVTGHPSRNSTLTFDYIGRLQGIRTAVLALWREMAQDWARNLAMLAAFSSAPCPGRTIQDTHYEPDYSISAPDLRAELLLFLRRPLWLLEL